MRYVIASDHAGVGLKALVCEHLRAGGYEVADLGTTSEEPADYPDKAEEVARLVSGGEVAGGVLVCGTGIGISIAANKIRGVRAAVCRSGYEARMARAHNDANVLCLGERVTGPGLCEDIISVWLETEFEGGRHQRRLDKIAALETGVSK